MTVKKVAYKPADEIEYSLKIKNERDQKYSHQNEKAQHKYRRLDFWQQDNQLILKGYKRSDSKLPNYSRLLFLRAAYC